MPNNSRRVPSYRRHKSSGQAVVTLNGRDVYLGKWNTAVEKPDNVRIICWADVNFGTVRNSNQTPHPLLGPI